MRTKYSKISRYSTDGTIARGSGGGSRRGAAAVVGGMSTILLAAVLVPLTNSRIWFFAALIFGVAVYLTFKEYVY